MPNQTFYYHIWCPTKHCIKLKISKVNCPVEQDVPHDIFMSQSTSAKPNTRHTCPRTAMSTSKTTNDTSEISQSTSFLQRSTWHPTSSRERMKKRTSWHCLQKLLAWSPCALHMSLRGNYGRSCFMWRHKKSC